MARRQGIFFLVTWSTEHSTNFPPEQLPDGITWLYGQREVGDGGFDHFQFIVAFARKQSVRSGSRFFPGAHLELTRSAAAIEYVRKEATRVAGSEFEFGSRPIRRNSRTDWETVWSSAKDGAIEAIPPNIRVLCYRAIRSIEADFARPPLRTNVRAVLYVGPTGTGKSWTAWNNAGSQAYSKDPRSKFWCGYQGETSVVVDEFRGGIDVAHFLRWLDVYPCHVEVKGGSRPLLASAFFITSNLSISDWWKDIDWVTLDAVKRRISVIEMTEVYNITLPN